LGLDLLRDAVARRDPIDVELSLVVCFKFGFSDDHLSPLLALAFADWHQRHEDVARALGKLRSPASVDALVHLAEWVPGYLDFDDARGHPSRRRHPCSVARRLESTRQQRRVMISSAPRKMA